jgi:ATP-binding cassette subfamily F protein uup
MAAPILSYENLGLVQGAGWLFRGLDLNIGERDRLALIGRNGAGKTTLLKLIAGQVEADEGRRSIVPGTKVVMLEQDPDVSGFATLRDFAVNGQNAALHEIEAIADQIGIDLSREAASASGGERRRAAICRALAAQPDLLLLDEPTNNLDIPSVERLEEALLAFLDEKRGTILTISHDRAFLDTVCTRIVELDDGVVRDYPGGFTWYDEHRGQGRELTIRPPAPPVAPGKKSGKRRRERAVVG